MAKPILYPEWAATDTTLPATGNTNKQRPKESLRNIGWDKGQIPTAEEWNWQFDNISDWVKWFDENNGASKTITLTGNTTGTASYNNEGGISISTTTSQAAHANDADQADKWTIPRTLSFTGWATGSGNIDGSGNVSIGLTYGSGFTSNKTLNGFMTRPDGMIEIWGRTSGTLGIDTETTVTFSTTFPNACLHVFVTPYGSSFGTETGPSMGVKSFTNSSAVIVNDNSSGWYCDWRAIGY